MMFCSDLKRAALTPALSHPMGEGDLQTRSDWNCVKSVSDAAGCAPSPIGWERAGVRAFP